MDRVGVGQTVVAHAASQPHEEARPGDSFSHVESRQLATQPSEPRANYFLDCNRRCLRLLRSGRAKCLSRSNDTCLEQRGL